MHMHRDIYAYAPCVSYGSYVPTGISLRGTHCPQELLTPFFVRDTPGSPHGNLWKHGPDPHLLKPRFDPVDHFLATQPVQSHLGRLATQPFLGRLATQPFLGHTAIFLGYTAIFLGHTAIRAPRPFVCTSISSPHSHFSATRPVFRPRRLSQHHMVIRWMDISFVGP